MSGRPWNEPPWWERNWRMIAAVLAVIGAIGVGAAMAWRMFG